jgi:hypothetical protein
VARVSDEAKLRRSLAQEVFKGDKGEILEGLASNPDPEKEFTAVFADGYVLLGKTENMRSSLVALRAEVRRDLRKTCNSQRNRAPRRSSLTRTTKLG